MGIKGLTRIIERHAPDLLRSFPTRFASIRGKRLVLDGNFFMMAFHHRKQNDACRHIKGWMTLVKELDKHNISAICVFDGKGRDILKTRLKEKTRATRERVKQRCLHEQDRCRRLLILRDILRDCIRLPPQEMQTIDEAVSDLPSFMSKHRSTLDWLLNQDDNSLKAFTLDTQALDDTHIQRFSAWAAIRLAAVYADYNASYGRLDRLTLKEDNSNPVGIDDHPRLRSPQQDAEEHEKNTWSRILKAVKSNPELNNENLLRSLKNQLCKSDGVQTKLYRRSHKPGRKTFDHCRELLRIAGIPCIDATGPIEAESLAASLVSNGHADFVATSDTDVIALGAPMLTGLCQSGGPFVMIGNPEIHVHTALGLSREAFTDLAIILGGHFGLRLSRSPKNVYELIKEYGTIENILESGLMERPVKDAMCIKHNYLDLDQLSAARIAYGTLPPVPSIPCFGPQPRMVNALQEYYLKQSKLAKKSESSINGFPAYIPPTVNEIFASISLQLPPP